MADEDEKSAGGKNFPWFRFFARDFLAQTSSMSAGEKGIYVVLLATMHDYGEPINHDSKRLARRAGATAKAFDTALDGFVQAGLIYRSAGKLWSPTSQLELENITKKSKSAQKSARDGWEKRQQNQRDENADAYRSQMSESEIDSHALKERERSSRDSIDMTSNVEDEAARGSAAPPEIDIADDIELPNIGTGWVEKIIRRKPLIVAAIFRNNEGFSVGYRVEYLTVGRMRLTEMTLDDIEALPEQPSDRDGNYDAA